MSDSTLRALERQLALNPRSQACLDALDAARRRAGDGPWLPGVRDSILCDAFLAFVDLQDLVFAGFGCNEWDIIYHEDYRGWSKAMLGAALDHSDVNRIPALVVNKYRAKLGLPPER